MMSLLKVVSCSDFEELVKSVGIRLLHFYADWAPQCKQINDVLLELASQSEYKAVVFAQLAAEDVPEVSQRLAVKAVPTVVATHTAVAGAPFTVVGRVDGARPADVIDLVKKAANKELITGSLPAAPKDSQPEDLNARLKKLVNSAPCVLFMKGSPDNPKCGFSRSAIELLSSHNAQFSFFDILTDEAVRQGLKAYSDFPTYPQLFVKGDLIGGLDIMKEMDAAGELESMLPKKIDLKDRLRSLINTAPIMVFMKGDRTSPRCGFSRAMMEILNETGLTFETFDILTDEEVRQGLKTYSNWPTYPQVYVKGELVGGLDIIKEMKIDGSLIDSLKGI